MCWWMQHVHMGHSPMELSQWRRLKVPYDAFLAFRFFVGRSCCFLFTMMVREVERGDNNLDGGCDGSPGKLYPAPQWASIVLAKITIHNNPYWLWLFEVLRCVVWYKFSSCKSVKNYVYVVLVWISHCPSQLLGWDIYSCVGSGS